MQEHQLATLIEKYANGQASPEETQQLNEWYRQKAYQDTAFPDDEKAVSQRMLARLNHAIKPQKKKANYRWYAALILLVLSVSAYFIFKPVDKPQELSAVQNIQPIVPGSNKAILTLAGGKRIELDGAKNGKLANQAGSTISKTTDGSLAYEAAGTNAPQLVYNTLSTPKGGQYQLTLPDGTHVWLNSATSLTFPTAFNGAERVVQLTGEAYFEVAKNPSKPFKIDVAGRQQVVVLGTHFNIEAYADDHRINTTLLEGSVKLLAAGKQLLMKPGETVINNLQGTLKTSPADVEAVMGWKNGLFVFNDESLPSAMQKAARWYNVEMEYLDGVDQKRLGGAIARSETITQLLDKVTRTSGINYVIKGRRVILMK